MKKGQRTYRWSADKVNELVEVVNSLADEKSAVPANYFWTLVRARIGIPKSVAWKAVRTRYYRHLVDTRDREAENKAGKAAVDIMHDVIHGPIQGAVQDDAPSSRIVHEFGADEKSLVTDIRGSLIMIENALIHQQQEISAVLTEIKASSEESASALRELLKLWAPTP